MIKICPVCNKEFKGRNKYTCSMACYAIYKSNTKKCVVCGRNFIDSPSNDTKTCSPNCSKEHRKDLYTKGIYKDSLKKAHEALPTHPLTGQFETHVNAKTWVMQSPTGEIYECRNLLLWLREHEDMLDGTARQAQSG